MTHTTPDPRRWLAFAVVLVAGFMDLLDVTIVNVTVPSIQRNLHAQYTQIEWIVSAYVLAFAAMLITGGRLGDIYGRKRVFLIGMAGFTIASALCGMAANPTMLITSRFAQGAMAGLMVPQILAIIRVMFPPQERARAVGIFGGVGGSASVFGLSLGGALVQWNLFDLGWRPIFLVNVPVGIIALAAAWFVVQDSRSPAAPTLDPIGMLLAISAVTLLVYPLTEGRRLHWPAWIFGMIIAAVVVFAAFLIFERRRAAAGASPLIEFAVFRARAFSVGLAGWLFFWIALGGFFLVWTLYMQAGLGWTPLHAGLTAVTFAVGAGVGAGTSPDLLVPKFGRRVLMAGALINALGFGGYAWLAWHYGANISSWQMIVPLVVSGVGFGMVIAPTLDMLLGQVPLDQAGAASGLLNTAQQLGLALGVALVGVLFFTQLDHTSGHGVDTVTAETRTELAALGLPGTAQDEILANFRACVHDRSAAVDPTVLPASCRPTATDDRVSAILTQAGAKANAENFSRTFDYTLWYGIGILALVSLGFTALPKRARLEHVELNADADLVEV